MFVKGLFCGDSGGGVNKGGSSFFSAFIGGGINIGGSTTFATDSLGGTNAGGGRYLIGVADFGSCLAMKLTVGFGEYNLAIVALSRAVGSPVCFVDDRKYITS